jgi:nitronate monooxygenase
MSALAKRLGMDVPLILAPMAGGPSTPALAAAVSNAGGLGSIAGGYLTPEQFARDAAELRSLTDKPFAMNLFVFEEPPRPSGQELEEMNRTLDLYRAELGIERAPLPDRFADDFDALLEVVLEVKPAVFSFTFGSGTKEMYDACRARGIATVGTATSIEEGVALQHLGADAVCAQGIEAGGHRGGDGDVGLMSLVPLLVETLDIPVVAAGGIMTRGGVEAALALGAEAAQLGTAFLLCPEAGTSKPYREAVARGGRTALTRAFSGRWARGIENRFLRERAALEPLPYPYQNGLTRDIRRAAAANGEPEFLSLWAGQGVALAQQLPAAELVARLTR